MEFSLWSIFKCEPNVKGIEMGEWAVLGLLCLKHVCLYFLVYETLFTLKLALNIAVFHIHHSFENTVFLGL